MLALRSVAVASLALVVSAGAAGAGSSRVETASYTGPSGVGGVMRVSGQAQGGQSGALLVPTRRTDRSVAVSAVDASGRPVRIELAQDGSGHGFVTDLGAFCGSTPHTVPLRFAGRPLQVYVVAGDCSGAVSAPTSGTVTTRFR